MLKTSAVLRQNIENVAALRLAMRRLHLHPATLLVIFLAAFLKLLGYVPMEFVPLGPYLDILVYCLRMVVYIGAAIWLLPYVIRWALVRNIPYLYASLGFLMFALVLNFAVLHGYFRPDGPSEGVRWSRLCKILPYSGVLHLLVTTAFESYLRPLLGRDVRLVPYFFPVPSSMMTFPVAKLLDGSLTGEVAAINAQNQYVAVYLMGQKEPVLLRMTFSAAMDRLPAGSGCQIHRSWWVAAVMLGDARFDAKQMVLTSGSGQPFPVSKSHVEGLQSFLSTVRAGQNLDTRSKDTGFSRS